MDKPPFPVSSLAMVLFGLSAMLDSGKHDDISFDDVKRHARAGDLIEFLSRRAGRPFASGFVEHYPAFASWYVEKVRDSCEAMSGRERRKYGISNRGLCLLISYTAEIIQQGDEVSHELP
jgi:hypothetical protein